MNDRGKPLKVGEKPASRVKTRHEKLRTYYIIEHRTLHYKDYIY